MKKIENALGRNSTCKLIALSMLIVLGTACTWQDLDIETFKQAKTRLTEISVIKNRNNAFFELRKLSDITTKKLSLTTEHNDKNWLIELNKNLLLLPETIEKITSCWQFGMLLQNINNVDRIKNLSEITQLTMRAYTPICANNDQFQDFKELDPHSQLAVLKTIQATHQILSSPRFTYHDMLKTKEFLVPEQSKLAYKVKADDRIFYLIAGTFKNSFDAQKVKTKILKANLAAEIHSYIGKNKTQWHQVKVGPYMGKRRMNAISNELADIGFSNNYSVIKKKTSSGE